jgi:hypothetical protein
VSHDEIIRAAAVVAAVALLAAPYRQTIVERLAAAAEAAKQHRGAISRIAAAVLLIAAAWGKIPIPKLDGAAVPAVSAETPSVEMQAIVAPVTAACDFTATERSLWAHAWTKAGVVVAADAVTNAPVFTDTRLLREYTALALDIAWRRIGQHQTGSNEPLRKAIESAYGQVVGTELLPVSADLRTRYVELVKAIAWAGTR